MILDDDALFCTECGVKLDAQPQEEMICPRCLTPMKSGNKVCPVCGYQPKKKKKVNKALIVVPLIVLIGAAAVGVGDYLVKNKPWKSGTDLSEADTPSGAAIEILSQDGQANQGTASAGGNSAQPVQTDPPAQQVQTDPPAQQNQADPTASADFWANAMDAVNNSSITLTGTVQEDSAGTCTLILSGAVNVCAFNENQTKSRVDNITQVFLYQGNVSPSGHNGDVAEVSGTFRFQGQTPQMTVSTLNVLQASVKEEDIHSYEVRIEDCTWEEAYSRCRSMGGYLVRINSLEEFNYLTQMLDGMPATEGKQFYIGARRDTGSDSYYLIDENNQLMGDRLDNGYTGWLSSIWLTGEPSYRDSTLGIDEYYVSMFRYGDDKRWVINDIPNDLIAAFSPNAGKVGYICEMAQ